MQFGWKRPRCLRPLVVKQIFGKRIPECLDHIPMLSEPGNLCNQTVRRVCGEFLILRIDPRVLICTQFRANFRRYLHQALTQPSEKRTFVADALGRNWAGQRRMQNTGQYWMHINTRPKAHVWAPTACSWRGLRRSSGPSGTSLNKSDHALFICRGNGPDRRGGEGVWKNPHKSPTLTLIRTRREAVSY